MFKSLELYDQNPWRYNLPKLTFDPVFEPSCIERLEIMEIFMPNIIISPWKGVGQKVDFLCDSESKVPAGRICNDLAHDGPPTGLEH